MVLYATQPKTLNPADPCNKVSSAPAPRPETRRQRPRRHVPSALKPASKSQCGNLEAVEAVVDGVDDRAVRENRRKAPPAGLYQIYLVSRVRNSRAGLQTWASADLPLS